MLAIALAALFFGAVCAGFARWGRGVTLERDAARRAARHARVSDSLQLELRQQRHTTDSIATAAAAAASAFEADSAQLLGTVRALRQRIAGLVDTAGQGTPATPAVPAPTLLEFDGALRGCLLSVAQCGAARASAEAEAAALRAENGTLRRQHQQDSTARLEEARRHAMDMTRAGGHSTWRSVKLIGLTTLAVGGGCAVSHISSFRGR
ncbi:MAG: hypothetical protein V4617_15055 [Gemmatimonadota bacterium]